MRVTLYDTKTGLFASCIDNQFLHFWASGHGSCDCYRSGTFINDIFEVGEHCGCNRFIVVDMDGDYEGLNKIELTPLINSHYDRDMVWKAKGKYEDKMLHLAYMHTYLFEIEE